MTHWTRNAPGILAAAMAAAWLAGCARPAPPPTLAAVPLAVQERPWHYGAVAGKEIRTAHYDIFTTHRDEVFLDNLPRFMENAFAHYGQLVKPSKQPAGPMPVFLFGERNQWDRFTDQIAGADAPTYHKIQAGAYVHAGRAVIYDIQRLKTFAVTGHEAFHQYIWHYTVHHPPPWLDEGLAVYFEGFHWKGDQLVFEPADNGDRRTSLRTALSRKATLTLPVLLSTHPGLVLSNMPGKVGSYYGQLWALVLFLQEKPYQGRFDKLLADIGSPRMIERARAAGFAGAPADFGPALFKAYIDPDMEAVGRQFDAYCAKLAGF